MDVTFGRGGTPVETAPVEEPGAGRFAPASDQAEEAGDQENT